MITHPATSVDFGYWFPLLAQALPEQWYSYPLASPNDFGRMDFTFLSQVVDPRPVGLSVPMVTATAALQAPLPQTNADSDSDPALLYLSVQQSTAGLSPQDDDDDSSPVIWNRDRRRRNRNRRFYYRSNPPTVTGPSLYRVVRAGSREAGVNRYSTVFSCVMRHDEWMEAERGKGLVPWRFERVGETSGLWGERRKDGGLRVFY